MCNKIKSYLHVFALVFSLSLLNSCATVKVVDSWKADDLSEIQNKNVLVITRTSNIKIRKIFEDAFMKRLKASDIKGNVSYNLIKDINTEKKLTENEVAAALQTIKNEGYNAIVLTVLKDRKSVVSVTKDGGYTSGATYSSEINPFLYDFYTAFGSPYTAPSMRHSGYYVEETYQEQEYVTFVLETLIFDLDASEKEQLKGQVTSKLESPGSAIEVADNYAKKVANALKK